MPLSDQLVTSIEAPMWTGPHWGIRRRGRCKGGDFVHVNAVRCLHSSFGLAVHAGRGTAALELLVFSVVEEVVRAVRRIEIQNRVRAVRFRVDRLHDPAVGVGRGVAAAGVFEESLRPVAEGFVGAVPPRTAVPHIVARPKALRVGSQRVRDAICTEALAIAEAFIAILDGKVVVVEVSAGAAAGVHRVLPFHAVLPVAVRGVLETAEVALVVLDWHRAQLESLAGDTAIRLELERGDSGGENTWEASAAELLVGVDVLDPVVRASG